MTATSEITEAIDVEPLGVEFSDEALDLLAALLVADELREET